MIKFKLTAGSAIILSLLSLLIISCEKPLDIDENVFTKYGIPMTGTQVVPANTSSATGAMDVIYVRGEHTLTYTINWSGLSGPPAGGAASPAFPGVTFPAIGVYGIADPGYMAVPYAPLTAYPNGVLQTVNSGFPAAISGTYKGSLYIDNVAIKEADLLNNKFYIQIRTAAFPNGQLRGQVDFR
jgi:hypothetical protein